MNMNWFIFALISFFGWSIGDIFGAVVSKKIGEFSATFWQLIVGFIASSLLVPLAITDLRHMTLSLMLLNLLLGALFIIGLVTFNKGLRIGSPARVGTITASFSAVTAIISFFVFHEQITVWQLLALIVIFSGIILSGLKNKIGSRKKYRLAIRGTWLAITTMVLWGIYYAFIKIPSQYIGWFWPQYITLSLVLVIWWIIRFKKIKIRSVLSKGAFWSILLNGILVAVGEYSFNYAVVRNASVVVAPIAGSYPVLYVLLAFFVFKDKLSRMQFFGIIINLLGIVWLAYLSS